MEKECRKCFLRMDIARFDKRVMSKDGLQYYCKSCIREDKGRLTKVRKSKHYKPIYKPEDLERERKLKLKREISELKKVKEELEVDNGALKEDIDHKDSCRTGPVW